MDKWKIKSMERNVAMAMDNPGTIGAAIGKEIIEAIQWLDTDYVNDQGRLGVMNLLAMEMYKFEQIAEARRAIYADAYQHHDEVVAARRR